MSDLVVVATKAKITASMVQKLADKAISGTITPEEKRTLCELMLALDPWAQILIGLRHLERDK